MIERLVVLTATGDFYAISVAIATAALRHSSLFSWTELTNPLCKASSGPKNLAV